MEVQLTSDQKAFARRAVESGRLQSEEEAVLEALALWEERERRRVAFLATLDDSRASSCPRRGPCHHAGIHAGACRRSERARTRPSDC